MAKHIGVLACQGAFLEHAQALRRLGVPAREVRLPQDLEGLDGLIIPGGESTTIGKLMLNDSLFEPVKARAREGMPVWGTCAGMIMLAKDVGHEQPVLGLMDIKVKRNAFGRQVDSFETDLDVARVGDNFHAVFIRAPLVEEVGEGVDVLARLPDGIIVAVQEGTLLATAFHPELTEDTRFHEYFLRLC